jgi:hypothetical protein
MLAHQRVLLLVAQHELSAGHVAEVMREMEHSGMEKKSGRGAMR